MFRKFAGLYIGSLLLAALCAAASGPMSQVVPSPSPSCLEQLASPISGGPTCGTCFGSCRSDPRCNGKIAGDLCTNTGGTCQVVGGCGLHDCCDCVNAGLAGVFATGGDVRISK